MNQGANKFSTTVDPLHRSGVKAWLKKRKWWVIGGITVLIIVVVTVVRSQGEDELIETSIVERTTIRDEVDVTGTVRPVERYDLSFGTAGVLNSLQVMEGDEVYVGQILARLDASDAALQVVQAKAVLIGDRQTAQLALDQAQEGLSDLKALNAARLEESKQAVRNAKTALDLARDQLQRTDEDTSVAYKAAESAHTAALNTYRLAQDSLNVLKQTIQQAETTSMASVASARNSVDFKQDIITDQGDLSVNTANLRYQQSILSKSIIRAPAKGKVAKIEGDVGEYIVPGTPFMTVISPMVQLVANVPETDAAKLSVDDPATVSFDAYRGEEFNTRITQIDSIETVIDGVTTYEVTLAFEEQDERLRSGMTAEIVILADQQENVLVIPQRGVSGSLGNQSVEVIRGEARETGMVETGLRGSEGLVEITSGLQEGDEVVTFDPNAEE